MIELPLGGVIFLVYCSVEHNPTTATLKRGVVHGKFAPSRARVPSPDIQPAWQGIFGTIQCSQSRFMNT